MEDDTDPVISTCADDETVYLGGGCTALVPDFASAVTASDNCGVASVTQLPTAGTTIAEDTEVTVTVSDAAGNIAQCTAWVYVEDDTDPVITTCADDETVYLGGGCTALMPDFTIGVTATDNCGVDSVTQLPTAGTAITEDTEVTVTVSDAAGNIAQCTAWAYVEDDTDPVIGACADDETVYLGGGCTALVPDFTVGVTATDNCIVASITQLPLAGATIAEDTEVTITVADPAGNTAQCTAWAYVEDNTDPVITICADDETVYLDGNCEASVPDFTLGVTVSDNCGVDSITQLPTAGTAMTEDTEVTITVSDAAGNTAECTAWVYVEDVTAPSIAFADVIVDAECGVPVVFPTPMLEDNCGVVETTITNNGGLNLEAPAAGSYTVEFTVEDGAGNTDTASLAVEVADTAAPVVAIEGSNPLYAPVGAAITLPEASAVDACDGPLTAAPDDLDGLNTADPALGEYSVVYASEADGAGLVGTAVLTVHVIEGAPPTITLIGAASLELHCGTVYEDPGASAEDYLGANLDDEIQISGTIADGQLKGPGVYTVTYAVTDALGIPATPAVRQVTVLDDCALALEAGGPTNVLAALADEVSFSVEVSGNVGSPSFQWKFNSANKSFEPILGAEDPIYVISSVSAEHVGQYACEASDAVTTVESDVFTLSLGTGAPLAGAGGLAALAAGLAALGAIIARKRGR